MTRYPKGTTVIFEGQDAIVLCEYPESVYIRVNNEVKNVKYEQVTIKPK